MFLLISFDICFLFWDLLIIFTGWIKFFGSLIFCRTTIVFYLIVKFIHFLEGEGKTNYFEGFILLEANYRLSLPLVTQIHDLRNRHCGLGIWYETYGRCSDFLTLRWVGIWEIKASAVERLYKPKYRTKNYCKLTWNICVFFAKLRQGAGWGVRQFSGCLIETKYEYILIRTVP